MASPVVIPKTPADSTTSSTSLHGKYILTMDDTDSSINRGSIHASGYYSVEDESTYDHDSKVVGCFRDMGSNPYKTDSVNAFSYSDRIELEVVDSDGDFNSALFFPTPSTGTDGCAFSFRLRFDSVSTVGTANTPRPYYVSQAFTGVSAGLFDFSTGNALILFFSDSNTIVIAGPSSDGNATRVTHSVPYTWSNESTYTIFFDYKIDEAVVTATQAEGDQDTILYKGSLSALGLCLEATALAGRFKGSSTELFPFISQDGRTVGDTLSITRFSLYSRSYKYISYGSFTKNTKDQVVYTKDSLLFTKDNIDTRLEGWQVSNVTPYVSGEHTAMEFSALAGYVKQPFLDLDNNSFMLMLDCYTTEFGFSGVNTGLGIDVLGNKEFKIRFLDGAIGIRTTNNVSLTREFQGYAFTPLEVTVNSRLLLSSDGTTFRLCVYSEIEGRYVERVTEQVANLEPNSAETGFSFVSELGSKGVVFASNLVFSATCAPILAMSATPTATANTVQQGAYSFTVTSPQKNSDNQMEYDPGPSSISGHFANVSKYSAQDSGLVCVYKGTLTQNVPVLPGHYNGPFVVLNAKKPNAGVATHGIHLCYTIGTDGQHYLFFPGDPQDSQEVAYQTNKGKSISFAINEDLHLFYCFRLVPNLGFWVYDLSDNMKEVFHTSWENIDGIMEILPTPELQIVPFPVDATNNNQFTAGVGVLDTGSRLKAVVDVFLVGTGRGLDISFYKNTDILPTLGIYGRRSRLLVTTEDND